MRKELLAAALSLLLIAGSVSQVACDKSEVLQQAGKVYSVLKAAIPVVQQYAPAILPKLEAAIGTAKKLKDAVAAKDVGNAILYLQELLPVFTQIVEVDLLMVDPAARSQILVAFALANIALSFLANYFTSNEAVLSRQPPRAGASGMIADYAKKPVWGYRYCNDCQ